MSHVQDPYSSTAAVTPVVPEPPKTISGTTREILSWVGNNRVRAVDALEAEKASEKPRQGLLADLTKLLK